MIYDIINYIILILGIIIASLFYVIANYYFRYGQTINQTFLKIFLISLLFGILTITVKVPILYFFEKDISIMLIHVIFLITSFTIIILYSKFILNEKIKLHTYIILILIVLLILLNHFFE
jgi:hypothetical protein